MIAKREQIWTVEIDTPSSREHNEISKIFRGYGRKSAMKFVNHLRSAADELETAFRLPLKDDDIDG